MITFKEVVEKLDRFTAPPPDGDHEQHLMNAMKAVYDEIVKDLRNGDL